MWQYQIKSNFNTDEPLFHQLSRLVLEFDQKLHRAFEVSASKPDLSPEDVGFPDSYVTLALYRLNSILTRIVDLDQGRYNLFHNYLLAPQCQIEEIVPGQRLCLVLDKALELVGDTKTIGVGHYLRAIVALTLDHEPEPAYGFPGQVLHHTFSAETLLWGLGYTAWTSLREAPEVRRLIEILGGREPTEDFQYLLTIENDRIVFRPTSILDSYSLKIADGSHREQLAVLTHFRDQYAAVTPDELLELDDLINDPRAKEPDFQSFFVRHPHFFRMWDYRDVFPHVYLTREDLGPLIPDFVLVDPDVQQAMLLDLKLPKPKIIVQKSNRERFSAAIDEARAQLHEYRDWFDIPNNRAHLISKVGMEIYRPRMGVLIGTNKDFRDALQRQKISSRYPDIEIVTYDDIVARAKRRLLLVKGASRGQA